MVKTVVNGASEGEIPDCTIAFELASWQGYDEIVRHLLQYVKPKLSEGLQVHVLGRLVCRAAELGYEEQVSLFLENGAHADAAPDKTTPLQYAARNGHASLVLKLLKQHDADVDSRSGLGADKAILLVAEKG